MRVIYFVPPLIAIGILGAWIGGQQTELIELEERVVVLKKRVTAGPSVEVEGPVLSLAERVKAEEKKSGLRTADGKIDWKLVGEKYAEMRGNRGMGDMKLMMEFQALLMEMEGPDLVQAVSDIRAADLPKEIEKTLVQSLVSMLGEKDPEEALKLEEENLGSSENSWQLKRVFQKWLEKDPVAAAAWFDQKISEGKFETKSLDPSSGNLSGFEGALVSELMKSGLGEVRKRLEKMTPEEQERLLKDHNSWKVDETNIKGYAELVRSTLSEKDQAGVLGAALGTMAGHDGGLEKISENLEKVEASPEVRAAAVEHASGSFLQPWKNGLDKFDDYVAWAEKEAPDARGELLGKALASFRSYGDTKKEEAIEKVKEMADDQVTASFLKEARHSLGEEVRNGLLETITDEALRASVDRGESVSPIVQEVEATIGE